MLRLRSLVLLFVVCTCLSSAFSQDNAPPTRTFQLSRTLPAAVDSPTTHAPQAPGDVKVTAPPDITKLMADYTARKHADRGYRVQIFLGDRKTAEDTKRGFLQKYPDQPAYLSWLAPNFRLRVGDLRTRLEAERLLLELRLVYPGSYIVPDDIEMPRLPEAP